MTDYTRQFDEMFGGNYGKGLEQSQYKQDFVKLSNRIEALEKDNANWRNSFSKVNGLLKEAIRRIQALEAEQNLLRKGN
jgi:hypothetical protein